MPSQWQGLKKKLNPDGTRRYPRRSSDREDEAFAAKVQMARADFATLEARGMAAQLLMLEEKKDLLEAWVKELNVDIAALNSLILDDWEARGETASRLDSGQLLHERIEPRTTVVDPEAWQAYLDAHPELDYMYDVGWQARDSFVKEILKRNADDEVPKCLAVDLRTTVGIRNS